VIYYAHCSKSTAFSGGNGGRLTRTPFAHCFSYALPLSRCARNVRKTYRLVFYIVLSS